MTFEPDGFIGTLLAIEGISDGRAVLNGPTGCRGHPAYFSDRFYPRESSMYRRLFEEPYFFGQLRIPCTYLDSDDYILGSTQKLQEILPLIAEKEASFLAVVNSPGASLIGDDIKRFLAEAHLDNVCMAFESAAYSRPFSEGFDTAIVAILRWLKLNRLPLVKNRVNLLGFSMIQKHWQGNVAEIRHLCELMGLSVVAVPGAGSSLAELRESVTVSCNIVMYPEYCRKTAEFYDSEFGIPAFCSPDGAPVGFSPTETWIHTIAEATGRDPTPALEAIKKQRKHAFNQISRCHRRRNDYPLGTTFAIRGDSSFVFPITTWLHKYLGMVPTSVDFLPGEDSSIVSCLTKYFEDNNLSRTIIGSDPAVIGADLYFGDSLDGRGLVMSGKCREYFEIFNRASRSIDFTQKTYLGGEGALFILENIFNAMKVFPKQDGA